MYSAPTESMAIEAGHKRLSADDLRALLLGKTVRGLYRGGFRFMSFVGHDEAIEMWHPR